MGRLERVCREVLTRHRLPLSLDLRATTEVDRTASAVLEQFTRRGAVVVTRDELPAAPCKPLRSPDRRRRKRTASND
jgi:hypothetical protein